MENIGDNIISKNFLRKYYHDMREPLRNVSSFLQIIKMDLINNTTNISDLLYYINNAINCLSILDDFNNSILNYNGKNKDTKPHNLNLIINKIVCLLSSQMIKRKCSVEAQDDLPLIKCSAIDLFRIFKNLIENAIKYAICDELKIKISCCEKINDRIILLFEDNGEVLSKETIIEIKRTLNEQIIGNDKLESFGLPIVRELIKQNNGNIELLEDHSGCAYKISLIAL